MASVAEVVLPRPQPVDRALGVADVQLEDCSPRDAPAGPVRSALLAPLGVGAVDGGLRGRVGEVDDVKREEPRHVRVVAVRLGELLLAEEPEPERPFVVARQALHDVEPARIGLFAERRRGFHEVAREPVRRGKLERWVAPHRALGVRAAPLWRRTERQREAAAILHHHR